MTDVVLVWEIPNLRSRRPQERDVVDVGAEFTVADISFPSVNLLHGEPCPKVRDSPMLVFWNFLCGGVHIGSHNFGYFRYLS